jgi:glycosyltransferase involved in cell wall biosynthesis
VSSRKHPKISIITVVKDDREGLLITFRSLKSQTYSNFEWIIVDSSLNHQEVTNLGSLENNLNVKIYFQEPIGIYGAMNFGVTKADGLWLWFINAGDVFLCESSISYLADSQILHIITNYIKMFLTTA